MEPVLGLYFCDLLERQCCSVDPLVPHPRTFCGWCVMIYFLFCLCADCFFPLCIALVLLFMCALVFMCSVFCYLDLLFSFGRFCLLLFLFNVGPAVQG